jgi:hypothetical protein
MRCDHEHDDGAYVLGALAPAERAAFERHLATCSFCREAVADIAVLPGLLGRLDPAEFAKLLDPTLTPQPAPPRRVVQPIRRREHKKTQVRLLSTALAAAVVALIVGIGLVFWTGGDGTGARTGPTVAMTAVADAVPITAQINLTAASGGTKINLVCYYNKASAALKPYTIQLVAYGADSGDHEQLGSWVASPGKEFSMTGVTHFAGGSLSRLELVRGTDGKKLLAYDVP